MFDSFDITPEQLGKMNPEDYLLVDVRDKTAYQHGFIPGAVHVEMSRIEAGEYEFPKEKLLVLYCLKGLFSGEAAEILRSRGYQAFNLAGGYGKWLLLAMEEEKGPDLAEIETGIRKRFHKRLFSRFAKAVNEYELVKEGDRIAV